MNTPRILSALLAVGWTVGFSSSASAGGHVNFDGLYTLVGPTLGMGVETGHIAPLLGLEISHVSLQDYTWKGVYADVSVDVGNGNTQLSVGPEIGALFVGLDTGMVAQIHKDGQDFGGRLRVVGTLGFFGVTLGWTRFVTRDEKNQRLEITIFGKLPTEAF